MDPLELGIIVALALAVVILAAALVRSRAAPDHASQDLVARAIQASADVGGLRSQVEHLGAQQTVVQQSLAAVQGVVQALEAKVIETGSGIRTELARDIREARRVIDEIKTVQETRREHEQVLHQAVERIEAVMAGRGRRGEAGEQIVAAALRQLPASMVEQGFKVNGKVVEFALVLPDGRRLPIDSKWTAGDLLQRLAETPPGPEADTLAEEIERCVGRRAREVAQYISPPATLPWAVAAVPDPAYALCRKAHLEAHRAGVIVLPYSLTLPYLLTLYQMHLQYAGSVDAERLGTALTQMERHLEALDRTLENSVARAITMLENAYEDLKRGTGDLRESLAGLRQPPQASSDALAEYPR
ncbi:MAG: DNA recombination protein RmuC [Armatimonadota bacterium]|nr:DNA recombination protein RmuC [Armatimonadota bacterium]MDR7574387.1 DNA recombination protein RmuC [Armatimonadota bacterium]MDR7586786.1 DNA recombination protein RmuC [Armatimonadota bacterium]